MRPRPGASRAPDPSVSAPIAGLTYPPNPETQSTSGAEMSDGPPEAFQGGAFEAPPQEAHPPFCRPLHISRVSLSLRYIMNLLHQDDFLEIFALWPLVFPDDNLFSLSIFCLGTLV